MKRHTRDHIVNARLRVIKKRDFLYRNKYYWTDERKKTMIGINASSDLFPSWMRHYLDPNYGVIPTGVYAKHKACGCKKARCYCCHGSKLMGEVTLKEYRALLNTKDMINEIYYEEQVNPHIHRKLGDPWSYD